jgi:hypothetical protein
MILESYWLASKGLFGESFDVYTSENVSCFRCVLPEILNISEGKQNYSFKRFPIEIRNSYPPQQYFPRSLPNHQLPLNLSPRSADRQNINAFNSQHHHHHHHQSISTLQLIHTFTGFAQNKYSIRIVVRAVRRSLPSFPWKMCPEHMAHFPICPLSPKSKSQSPTFQMQRSTRARKF